MKRIELRKVAFVIDKAKAHLESTKPPKRHIPLDPNKLPTRRAKPIHKEPRTKSEEFTEGKKLKAESITQNPILVASNGPLTGLLSSDPALYAQDSMLQPHCTYARQKY